MPERATGYPLAWPPGFPRATRRERGSFKTTLVRALENVETSLRLFGKDSGKPVVGVVMSSNVTLGSYYPVDPGVAVYFTWEGLQVCIPVDRYDTVAGNLQAIHHIIEARRVELRHGTLALVRATFQGFAALPAPSAMDWRAVLRLQRESKITNAMVEEQYRKLARERHPDTGGSDAMMAELNAARVAARREING